MQVIRVGGIKHCTIAIIGFDREDMKKKYNSLTKSYYVLTGFVSLAAKLAKIWGVQRRSAVRRESSDPTSCHRGGGMDDF